MNPTSYPVAKLLAIPLLQASIGNALSGKNATFYVTCGPTLIIVSIRGIGE